MTNQIVTNIDLFRKIIKNINALVLEMPEPKPLSIIHDHTTITNMYWRVSHLAEQLDLEKGSLLRFTRATINEIIRSWEDMPKEMKKSLQSTLKQFEDNERQDVINRDFEFNHLDKRVNDEINQQNKD